MEPSVTFQLHDIPSYLQGSAFYQTLNRDDEDEITLPTKVFKQDITVNNIQQATHLLATLQFWGSDLIPEDIVRFIVVESRSEGKKLLDQFNVQFPTVRFLTDLFEGSDTQRVNLVLTQGNMQVVAIVVENSPQWDRESACRHAAIAGHLCCLEYIHKQGGTLDRTVSIAASRGGHIECMQYAHENGVQMDSFFTCCAVENGRLEMLKYLHAHDCPWDFFTARCAAEHGQLECLKFAHENGCRWGTETTTGAAASGQLEILQYLHAQGCPWDTQATQNAAYHGRLQCLKFLHKHHCPWNSNVPSYAALRGNFDCLKFLHENGCPWDALSTAMAAERNSFEMFEYMVEKGCPISPSVYRWAARYGNIAMMRLAHARGVGWSSVQNETVLECARYGSVECLVFARECGCPLSSVSASYAAVSGHLDCLKYILANVSMVGDTRTCAAAAEHGHLECLIYAHTHRCGWDESTTKTAARKGHLECLRYAVENGCTINKEECYLAAMRGNYTSCADYIVSLAEGASHAPIRTKACWCSDCDMVYTPVK